MTKLYVFLNITINKSHNNAVCVFYIITNLIHKFLVHLHKLH